MGIITEGRRFSRRAQVQPSVGKSYMVKRQSSRSQTLEVKNIVFE